MFENLPEIGKPLTEDQIKLLQTFSKSCRQSILKMVTNAQSGHPGGSLSCIDYLTVLYCFIISQTGEKVTISNGHISPGVYSTLAELGYIPKDDVIKTFRKIGSIYEGHITRHVPGVEYGTGPLGIGVSVSTAFALADRMRAHGASAKRGERLALPALPEAELYQQKAFFLAGDGECQEGQVHEMVDFAQHHKIENLIGFIDYNKVQLSASLKEIMDINIVAMFKAAGWHVIEIDAHNFEEIWNALGQAYQNKNKPTVIIGHSIMGQGSEFMQPAGENHKADWHGKAPKPEEIETDIQKLELTEDEQQSLKNFRKTHIKWHPKEAKYPKLLDKVNVNTGDPIVYEPQEVTDCRTAYGKALLDLAKRNPKVIALTADLKASVMTKFVSEELPEQYYECGIAEQHMVSCAGGFSLDGFIPFASTFGAFMSSRAKDQARVNDINCTNVKMVATHCGLSVGEDGPTHQAIDDMSSFLGFFNTMVIEPADPNQTDRIIRYIASHYGNFYVRMGRHKFPIITKEDGTPFYDQYYEYEYGQSDVIRTGENLTIAATGAMIIEALKAREMIKERYPKISIELVAVSSIKKFDQTLSDSIKKTGKLLTIEDHNINCGLGNQLAAFLEEQKIAPKVFKKIGVTHYQLSGTAQDLYKHNGLDAEGIKKTVLSMID